MTALRCCTFTGVDEQTNLDGLFDLSKSSPIPEWGVLWSASRQKKDQGIGRYPREGWIREFIAAKDAAPVRTALHICGSDALDFLRGKEELWELASHFTRVQLNVRARGEHGDQLADDLGAEKIRRAMHSFTFSHGHGRIVVQSNEANARFCDALRSNSGMDVLIDGSGSKGISPESWPNAREMYGMHIGYAGGLGPDNIKDQLALIDKASCEKPFWIDMEGKLRNMQDGDRFDLARCEVVLRHVTEHLIGSHIDMGAQAQSKIPFATNVADLEGFALNWYAGLAAGYPMNPPPDEASRATYLDRFMGEHRGFSPIENLGDFKEVLGNSDVGCIKRAGQWVGVTEEGLEVKGSSRDDAMLRARIAEELGTDLPVNPAMHPVFLERWAGADFAQELLMSKRATIRP